MPYPDCPPLRHRSNSEASQPHFASSERYLAMFKTISVLQSVTKASMMRDMESAAKARKPRNLTIHRGDARDLDWISDESIHLVVTSPPYWTLKRYPEHRKSSGTSKTMSSSMTSSIRSGSIVIGR